MSKLGVQKGEKFPEFEALFASGIIVERILIPKTN